MEDWKAAKHVAEARESVVSKEIREALKQKSTEKAHELAASLLTAKESEPIRTRYIVNDCTVEKLGELLNQNPHGLLVFRDELAGFLRTLDKVGQEGARAFYLESWNGTGRFVYDRIGRGTVEIEAACLSILGGIQPGPLSHYLRGTLESGIGDDGLIQRFQLLVWPDIAPDWTNVDRQPESRGPPRGEPSKSNHSQGKSRLKAPRKAGALAAVKRKLWWAILHAEDLMSADGAPPEQRRQGIHARTQASLAYLKVLEACELEARIAALEARL